MLESVVDKEDLPSVYEVVVSSGPMADKATVLNKIKELNGVIMKNKSRGTQYYCLLGNELAKYKLLYYERCGACASKDMYSRLACKICSKNSNMKFYFDNVKSATSYGKSHVNFLISMAKLADQYPKFARTSMSLFDIKVNMSYLSMRISKESSKWK